MADKNMKSIVRGRLTCGNLFVLSCAAQSSSRWQKEIPFGPSVGERSIWKMIAGHIQNMFFFRPIEEGITKTEICMNFRLAICTPMCRVHNAYNCGCVLHLHALNSGWIITAGGPRWPQMMERDASGRWAETASGRVAVSAFWSSEFTANYKWHISFELASGQYALIANLFPTRRHTDIKWLFSSAHGIDSIKCRERSECHSRLRQKRSRDRSTIRESLFQSNCFSLVWFISFVCAWKRIHKTHTHTYTWRRMRCACLYLLLLLLFVGHYSWLVVMFMEMAYKQQRVWCPYSSKVIAQLSGWEWNQVKEQPNNTHEHNLAQWYKFTELFGFFLCFALSSPLPPSPLSLASSHTLLIRFRRLDHKLYVKQVHIEYLTVSI